MVGPGRDGDDFFFENVASAEKFVDAGEEQEG